MNSRKFPLWGVAVITSTGDRKQALLSARKQGKIRSIGFTPPQSPDIHLKMLQPAFAHQFTFDAVQYQELANQRGHPGANNRLQFFSGRSRLP